LTRPCEVKYNHRQIVLRRSPLRRPTIRGVFSLNILNAPAGAF
jgi:hypothetical protein